MSERTAKVSMLIRCAPAEAFDAFVDPSQITRFWLAATSSPLAPGAEVVWQFMVPGATETASVTAFDPPRRIAFDWSSGLSVRLDFEPHGDAATRLTVEVDGFAPDAAVAEIVNAAEGFSIVLCDLKTLIETGRSAGLVKDKAQLIAASR